MARTLREQTSPVYPNRRRIDLSPGASRARGVGPDDVDHAIYRDDTCRDGSWLDQIGSEMASIAQCHVLVPVRWP